MRRTNWSTHLTFGGEPLTSRACFGRKVAATDHCVAIVRTCPHCYGKFVATPTAPNCACLESQRIARYMATLRDPYDSGCLP